MVKILLLWEKGITGMKEPQMLNAPESQNQAGGFLAKTKNLVESARFQNFIMVVIILNAITMGMQTSDSMVASYGTLLEWIDKIALGVFIIEIILKLIVYRLRFFLDGWNLFDFFVVGIAVVPHMEAFSVLRALRTLRALRGLRLLSVMSQMREVMQALFSAIPGMSSIAAVMGLFFYIGAVLSTSLFGDRFEDWFGTLGSSMYTLFQVMTLESWSMGIVRPVMDVYPWAWLFFIPFIVLTSFAVLNLFIAVLVNAMQSAHEEEQEASISGNKEKIEALTEKVSNLQEGEEEQLHSLQHDMKLLHQEIAELRSLLVKKSHDVG